MGSIERENKSWRERTHIELDVSIDPSDVANVRWQPRDGDVDQVLLDPEDRGCDQGYVVRVVEVSHLECLLWKSELLCGLEDAFDGVECDTGLCHVAFEVAVVPIARCVLDGIEDDGDHSEVR